MKMKTRLIMAASLFICSTFAHATSFNCLSRNIKPFEEKICFDESLSKLDEQVNSYYEDAIKVSVEPDVDKREQKTSMGRRKSCKTSNCLKSIYEFELSELKEKVKKYLSFNPNKPAYPVWISPILKQPRTYETFDNQILQTCKDLEFGGTFAFSKDVSQMEDGKRVFPDDYQRFQPLTSTCKALEIMKAAQAANQSAVKDFVFTEKSVDVLPDFLILKGGHGGPCESYNFNLSRIPLNQSNKYRLDSWDKIVPEELPKEQKIISTVIDKNHLLLKFQYPDNPSKKDKESQGERLDIKILGKGDLLGTGWESILVQVIESNSSDPKYYQDKLFILTRKKEGDVFKVANPEQYLITQSGDGSVMCLPQVNAP